MIFLAGIRKQRIQKQYAGYDYRPNEDLTVPELFEKCIEMTEHCFDVSDLSEKHDKLCLQASNVHIDNSSHSAFWFIIVSSIIRTEEDKAAKRKCKLDLRKASSLYDVGNGIR